MRFERCSTIACVLCLLMASSASYKILFMPLIQGSHISCMMGIARELGRRQHEAHILLDDEYKVDKETAANARKNNITIERFIQKSDNSSGKSMDVIQEAVNLMINGKLTVTELTELGAQYTAEQARTILLENEPLVEKLGSAHYDLAVIDGMFATKQYYLLAHRLGLPWITYTDYPDPWAMRVPWLPSIVPGKFSSQSEKMTFLGRISNALLSTIAQLNFQSIKVPDNIIKQYQKYGSFDSVEELAERSKFWILTSDAIIDTPRPMMPHMTEVGGLTTQPAKKLPEDIQSFLDGAEDGVILVTFGSMLSSFPDAMLKKFLEAFNRIERHRIIWRLTNVSAEFQLPDYVRAESWLPQNDILAHPKVKLFITHCGNNGQFEALYHGVPMIGFPFIGDQRYNAIRIEYKGYGISMNIQKFTSDELYANIMKIFNDPTFKRRIARASEIFRSAPQRPAEKAAYWIEHVIKFGSDHLQIYGRNLNFFQYFLLDVLITCLIVGIFLLVLMKKLVLWGVKKVLEVRKNVKVKIS